MFNSVTGVEPQSKKLIVWMKFVKSSAHHSLSIKSFKLLKTLSGFRLFIPMTLTERKEIPFSCSQHSNRYASSCAISAIFNHHEPLVGCTVDMIKWKTRRRREIPAVRMQKKSKRDGILIRAVVTELWIMSHSIFPSPARFCLKQKQAIPSAFTF